MQVIVWYLTIAYLNCMTLYNCLYMLYDILVIRRRVCMCAPTHRFKLLEKSKKLSDSTQLREQMTLKRHSCSVKSRFCNLSFQVNPRCLANVHHSDCISKPCLPTRLMGDHTTTWLVCGSFRLIHPLVNLFFKNLIYSLLFFPTSWAQSGSQ